MTFNHKPTIIEKAAEALHVIPDLHANSTGPAAEPCQGEDCSCPPPESWDSWVEYDSTSWPERKSREYMLVPTSCFNCEAGCGLLAYIEKETMQIRKFTGNPYHPASRGRNCAKGPATINQVEDSDRILYPLKRVGPRGSGKWARVSWESVLEDISSRMRKALQEKRNNEISYHVGRPGHEGFMDWVLKAWGVDGHNSHTNICSSGARFGYAIWQLYDRPSPDHSNAKFILLVSAHLEAGHYFNPHAQRIVEGRMKGAKLAVLDPRLSNTASMSDYWMPSYPGSEPAVLLAMAKVILDEGLYNRDYLENWVNWQQYLESEYPDRPTTFEAFIEALSAEYNDYTPEYAEKESGVPAATIRDVARQIGEAGERFSTHVWRSASSGNLGGWEVSRTLHFLNVLTGSVGTPGGTAPSAWNKFKPTVHTHPEPQKFWNPLHLPDEYPLAHYEMSFLLPHMLKEGRGKLDVYFTRVFNPVWTYPDGFSWIEALEDESKIGLHVALTPTWNETAYFADYVLPMGHSPERHDLVSYETHAGKWIAFRQPVLRVAHERRGTPKEFTWQANVGEVWEEDEFWIELSWRIDPDGSLGVKKHFESPYRSGEKITINEYYQYIFEHTPNLAETAEAEGLTPLAYMKKYGAFEIETDVYNVHETPVDIAGANLDGSSRTIYRDGKPVGIQVRGENCVGFPTPSRKQELYSQTMIDWKWPEHRLPSYIKSHVHPETIDRSNNEFALIPTFRLPVLIHSRSGNAKWLAEIAHRNPLWINADDAAAMGIENADLVRVNTDIGYHVNRAWVTESIRPGVVACSHHIGRWRRDQDAKGNRWATNLVSINREEKGKWRMRVKESVEPFESPDPDSGRIFWSDGGVHQNITFPVHPDPISGMHCWHQKVRIEKAHADDQYGDVFVDTDRSFEIYKEWLAMTRPAPGPGGLRRPMWLNRPLRPADETYYIGKGS
ncbi:molydopterin dinucleotide-binding region [Prosthecochloris aestuarii DSM 271]|uniref:Molydopterin dinucleotide-binding region n=1 Tax=Prosthecochloris aestuarii (strain DSM 271 / SK 413) TaxID=290512 RepID=B4S990_PROA2|nr:molybdopterin-dependent oxidoreductase [Prosthecochloris aestuarii]ACF45122.1 molydopterin dinucleotide-binding region [Prosthecochloris aestuarii DSM 271]